MQRLRGAQRAGPDPHPSSETVTEGTPRPVGRRQFLGLAAGLITLAVGGEVLRRSTPPAPRTAAATMSEGGSAVGKVHMELDARPQRVEIAAGVPYDAWTFGGTVPGPVLRVRQGDQVEFVLHNKDPKMPHAMDFHAAQTPPNVSFRDAMPGASVGFTWRANYPGVFMYHCGTAPVLMHIANGMYGAIIVDPAEPRPPAREYVLVQSEFYSDPNDLAGMMGDTPRYVVFNGRANKYLEQPLEAAPRERIRLYVVNAGPNRFSAFHVVGAIFDRVEQDADPAHALRGVQTVTVPPGGGAIFELVIPDPGDYPVVTHSFGDATRGALGKIRVVANPRSLPLAP